jgi:RNA recognition motif-containing protein
MVPFFMKLIIRNLERSTTEKELLTLFEAYGKVQYCTIIKDKESGDSKGFAFVEMPKVGDAKAAMKNLNNKDIKGEKIRVKKAEKQSDK